MEIEAALFKAIAKQDGKLIDFDTAMLIVREAVEALRSPDLSFDPASFTPAQYNGLVFHVERMRDIVDGMRKLHEAHWQETEGFRHDLNLDFDYDRVIGFERNGNYMVFTVRLDGELVGASGVYIDKSVHTKTLVATEDTIYFLPVARRGLAASRFLDYMKACVARIGVREVYITTKLANKASLLFKRYGFKHIGNQFCYLIEAHHEAI